MSGSSILAGLPPWVKVGLWLLLLLVLGLGMMAYTMPGMRLNWETIASMCGF